MFFNFFIQFLHILNSDSFENLRFFKLLFFEKTLHIFTDSSIAIVYFYSLWQLHSFRAAFLKNEEHKHTEPNCIYCALKVRSTTHFHLIKFHFRFFFVNRASLFNINMETKPFSLLIVWETHSRYNIKTIPNFKLEKW
jgi:hypothetical protein